MSMSPAIARAVLMPVPAAPVTTVEFTSAIATVKVTASAAIEFRAMPAIIGHVAVTIPIVAHEIHRAAASTISPAIIAPVLGLARRHAQIDGGHPHELGCRCNHDRLRVDQLWRGCATNIELTVEPRFAHADGYTHLGHGGKRCSRQDCRQNHVFHLLQNLLCPIRVVAVSGRPETTTKEWHSV